MHHLRLNCVFSAFSISCLETWLWQACYTSQSHGSKFSGMCVHWGRSHRARCSMAHLDFIR